MRNAFSAQSPETVIFALDLDPELGTEVSGGTTRLDVVKHAITNFILAKKRLSANHKFGLAALRGESAELLSHSISYSISQFLSCLQQLQPSEDPSGNSSGSGGSRAPLDLGSLVQAVAPLQQQQQPHAGDLLHLHQGTLSVPSNSKSDSHNSYSNALSTSSPINRLRVILIYGRSCLPAPKLDISSNINSQGLAIDCLYIHDKPQPGVNHPQEVYSALEDLVDQLSVRAGHAGFVYETTAGRFGKLLSSMAMLLSHPQQRLPQSQTKAPVDLSTAPLMMLPSDAANAASGVPIMTAKQLNKPLPGSAWAKPLSVSPAAAAAAAAAAGSSSSNDQGPWGTEAAATAATSSSITGSSSHPLAQSPWASSAGGGTKSNTPKPHIINLIDPWDEPADGTDAGPSAAASAAAAAAATPVDLLQPLTIAVASSSGAGSSSSSSSSEGVVTGVPVTTVAGVPDRRPSYDYSEDGVAVGYAVTDSTGPQPGSYPASFSGAGAGSAAVHGSREGPNQTSAALPAAVAAASASAASAAATVVVEPSAPSVPGYGGVGGLDEFQGLIVDEDVDPEELEGLRAALMASAIEAQMQQEQQR